MASVGKTLQGANVSTIAIVEVEKHSVELREKNCLRRRKESLQVTNYSDPSFGATSWTTVWRSARLVADMKRPCVGNRKSANRQGPTIDKCPLKATLIHSALTPRTIWSIGADSAA